MREIRSELKQIMTEMLLFRKTVIEELDHCPKGRMIRTFSQGRPVIMHIINSGKDRKRKIITGNRELQTGLARRSILEKDLLAVDRQLSILKDAAERIAENSLLDRMRFAIGNFGWLSDEELRECCFPEEQSGWASEPYPKLDYRPGDLRHTTSFGLKVRSKSELLIAEALHRHGLQFRYEQVYTVDKYTVSAVFSIMRADGKLFIWEHEGLMGQRQYAQRQRRKAEIFEMLGFCPWDNMIITYDTGDGNADLRIIGSEIQNKLLI